ncbi:signal transduction histidine kinase/GNAT superfamily N-acetyltransferase [Oxalobacteraceae bacterium GrIS 1.18]
MITIKRLSAEQIEDACLLLYQVYIEQQRWIFDENNPSLLRIDTRNDGRILIDRFTDQAVWFGAFSDAKLVGCVRVSYPDENGRLEIEGYPGSKVIQQYLPTYDKSKCVEISRLAVKEKYIGRGLANKKLLLACFRYCQHLRYSVLTSTTNSYLKLLFKKIEFPLKAEHAFKYEAHDQSAVHFYFADYQTGEVNDTLQKLEFLESDISNNAKNILQALHIAESIIPTPFYWMDSEGVVLGINDLALKAMGTTREIIGKKPYAFYKKHIADHILNHNQEVIRKEEILCQEEWIEEITTKERKCFSSIKAPLYDDGGMVIGIVGTSVEITAEKEAEQLRRQVQEKITSFARKVAHDLKSPIAALKMLANGCPSIPPDTVTIMNNAIDRLNDISDNLLDIREDFSLNQNIEQQQNLALAELVSEMMNEKRVEHQNKAIEFEFRADPNTRLVQIKIQKNQFKRSLSNLINNAVDALVGSSTGSIIVSLRDAENQLTLSLHDNGKGMHQSTIDKILKRTAITHGKNNGHGLGLQQVWDMLDANSGQIRIESTVGLGTTVELTFPKTSQNKIAEKT